MSAINPASVARAKEAIAAGKKLEAADPAPAKEQKKGKPAGKAAKDTPKTGAKAAAKGGKPQVDDAAAKAAAKAKEAADKAAAKTKREAEAKAAREAKEKEQAAAKADKAAAYQQKIEDQKAATIARHKAEKLFNSFRARVKYMLYMDNPALGGLEGREALGWALKHRNSTGDTYTVERVEDQVRVNQLLKGGEIELVGTAAPIEADVLALMSDWVA